MELKKKKRLIDKNEVPTYQTTIYSGPSILEVEVGTNGNDKNNEEYNVKTYLRLKDNAGIGMEVNVTELNDVYGNKEVELSLSGKNHKLTALINALDYMSTILKAQKERIEIKKRNYQVL